MLSNFKHVFLEIFLEVTVVQNFHTNNLIDLKFDIFELSVATA